MKPLLPVPFRRGRPIKYQWSEMKIGEIIRVRLNGSAMVTQKASLHSSAKNAGVKISVSCTQEVGFLHAIILEKKTKK